MESGLHRMTSDEHLEPTGSMRVRQRLPVLIAVGTCVLLVPIELGWVPFFRSAWAFNLWQYLPASVAPLFALAALLLCWHKFREFALRVARGVYARTQDSAVRRIGWVALVAMPFVFYLLRERQFLGDSILILQFGGRWWFHVPELGGGFLFRLAFFVGDHLEVERLIMVQGLVCFFGAVAVACFVQLSRYIGSTGGHQALAAAFILCGGVSRVFFGHVEMYAFVLACAGAYFWSAFAFLRGRCSWVVPSIALGIGIWMHLSLTLLIPTLVLLFHQTEQPQAFRHHVKRWAAGLALAAVPTLLFLIVLYAAGQGPHLLVAWRKQALVILGVEPSPIGWHYWMFGGGDSPSMSGDYDTSWCWHLKYLANAFFILVPAVIPVVLGFVLFWPRRFFSTPQASFLALASLCTVVYACVLRPFWGSHDWDLFSLTAICLASLAALLLVNWIDDPPLSHLSILLIGASLFFVTIPFLIVGISASRPAGPFTQGLAVP
jgi:hypothetical protein